MAKATDPEEEEIVVSAAPVAVKSDSSWVPVLVMILVMPLISYGMTQYVLIPKIKSSLGESAVKKATSSGEKSTSHGAAKAKGNEETPGKETYAFDNIVVNLSGAKGTRYLKTSFTLVSSNPNLKEIITQHRIELLDVTLNILSGKTLVDLEVSGAKNMLRHDLIENFNQTLKSTVVEQIFFSEFVIQ